MTRKDYIAFAKVFNDNLPHATDSAEVHEMWRALQLDMADTLRRDNSTFDYGRFFAACLKPLD